MNLSLLAFLILIVVVAFGTVLRRHVAYLAWILSLLVFPTVSVKIADAPIYVYDALTCLALVTFAVSGDFRRWPRGLPRWHWWFIGGSFVLSVVFGVVRHGLMPELFWIWGHTALSWLGYAFAVMLLISKWEADYRRGLQWGIMASLVILAAMASVQYLDLPGSEQISQLFYGDIGSVQSVEGLRVGPTTNRATGPHFAPTCFSGMALLTVIVYWLLAGERQVWQRWLVTGLGAWVVLCTVSRHTMIAAAFGVLVMIALSDTRRRIKLITFGALAVVLLGLGTAGFFLKQSWGERFARMDHGILEDENIAARILWGPARLAEAIGKDPTILITGAGLDPEKIAQKSGVEHSFGTGFVSNGYLLALYYLGLPGFVMFGLFWLWAFFIGRKLPPHSRSVACGFVAMAAVIVAADNYSFMYEPAQMLLFLIVGLIAGKRHLQLVEESAVHAGAAAASSHRTRFGTLAPVRAATTPAPANPLAPCPSTSPSTATP